ncbi:MAG: type I restriction enzyme HsdR N-terminal domain-containing protein [Prevotella sp.]|nr:type I restriction enzyme HsdR N-terminal domain-containing protein [Prevotella sp.]
MNERWNEIVNDLIDARHRNMDENMYHNVIENLFKQLGWMQYKDEIRSKHNIPIGNNNYIQPDILIRKNDEDLFVIEVKRPVHNISDRERLQLESYMRQLKLKVGIYIGEYIEVLYDQPDGKHAISILEIPLEMDNKDGIRFCKLFCKETFNKEDIIEFCENRVKETNRQENLYKIKKDLIENAQTRITEGLKLYLAKKHADSFSEDDITGMLAELLFTARSKDSQQMDLPSNTGKLPYIEQKQKNKKDYTKYSLNGGQFLPKRKLILAIVSTYIKEHPQATFAELEIFFGPELGSVPKLGVIRTTDYIRENNLDETRFFPEILRSGDGIDFRVCNQWNKVTICGIINKATQLLGYNIQNRAE